MAAEQTLERAPFISVWKNERRNFFVAIGARMAENTAGFFLQVWTISYVTQTLHINSAIPVAGVLLGAAIGCVTIPLFGALSDRIGRRPVYIGGSLIFGADYKCYGVYDFDRKLLNVLSTGCLVC